MTFDSKTKMKQRLLNVLSNPQREKPKALIKLLTYTIYIERGR